MNCESCGNPVDRQDAERGSCLHCGVVLPHVLRAAEKAEIVRQVVAQGGNVRIEGDRIEAGAPPAPPEGTSVEIRGAPIVIAMAATMTVVSIALFVFLSARPRDDHPSQPKPLLMTEPKRPFVAPPALTDPVATARPEKIAQELEAKVQAEPTKAQPRAPQAPASPRTVEGVVAANKAQYDRCQRAELGRNPAAARRYSVAVTVDGQGRAEWVELLSEASAEMKSCVQAVTRGLEFPRPAAGSSRSIVTLSFAGSP